MEVAKIIIDQIKTLDKWALGAWGAKNFVGGKIYRNQEGIKFQVNGSKVKRGTWVMILLDESQDLYDIIFYRIYKCELKIDKSINGIYCDQLVEIIDSMIG